MVHRNLSIDRLVSVTFIDAVNMILQQMCQIMSSVEGLNEVNCHVIVTIFRSCV